jgi:glucose-1-phosphate cytidylyltransferase
MKAVILAGGLGTRLSEETTTKPKPMVEIGGKPILWHIMKTYSIYGINDFVICCGYKGYLIKEYFNNYFLHQSDVTVNLANNSKKYLKSKAEKWNITLVDTGDYTMTGGRLKRIKEFIDEDEFCMTYGDGVADINISKSIDFHRSHGKFATITAVYPPGRFGALNIVKNMVTSFEEKPKGDGGLINGGFFVLNKKVLDYIKDDNTLWEQEPLKNLANDDQLMAFEHKGFWQPMDTLRDKNNLENLYKDNKAPWKKWE